MTLHSVDLGFGNFDAWAAASLPEACLCSSRRCAAKEALEACEMPEMVLEVDGMNKWHERETTRSEPVQYGFRKNKRVVVRCQHSYGEGPICSMPKWRA